jgi:hypothetical protein
MGANFTDDETLFLKRVVEVLDDSLVREQASLMRRLDSVRHSALLQLGDTQQVNIAARADFVPALDESTEQLPEAIRLRLDGIRAQALQRARAAHSQKSRTTWWQGLWPAKGFALPASAFASISVLVTTLAIFNGSDTTETMPLLVAENSLVLASEAELELYENLEFYQWLADNGLQY